MTNAKDAAAASVPVVLMRFTIQTAVQTSFSTGKMAEYAQAVCHGRPCFHISLVQDISPNCDCHGENDAPILPDIGMFASFDPVALDQACADACLKATPIENSQLGEHLAEPGWHCHHDHFKDSNPNIEWQATLDQAEKIGLGTRQYELKRIK